MNQLVQRSYGLQSSIIFVDQLKSKIQELQRRFDLAFQEMLEIEADKVYTLSWRIGRLHAKLSNLSEEVERVRKSVNTL